MFVKYYSDVRIVGRFSSHIVQYVMRIGNFGAL